MKKLSKLEKTADKEFRKLAKRRLLKPGKCKKIQEANYCIHQMHAIIQELKFKFNYVPHSARLRFNQYQNIQDRMVYENFRKSYQNVLC